MRSFIAATILGIGLASPALAFGPRAVEFDPTAELRQATGSAQFPESRGGIIQQHRPTEGGSQAMPNNMPGFAHTGSDVLVGSSSRYPVLTPDIMSHPPTALSQDQHLVHEFDGTNGGS